MANTNIIGRSDFFKIIDENFEYDELQIAEDNNKFSMYCKFDIDSNGYYSMVDIIGRDFYIESESATYSRFEKLIIDWSYAKTAITDAEINTIKEKLSEIAPDDSVISSVTTKSDSSKKLTVFVPSFKTAISEACLYFSELTNFRVDSDLSYAELPEDDPIVHFVICLKDQFYSSNKIKLNIVKNTEKTLETDPDYKIMKIYFTEKMYAEEVSQLLNSFENYFDISFSGEVITSTDDDGNSLFVIK